MISLADDRHLLVLTWDELGRVDRLWPGINGEPATARVFTDDELAAHDARVRAEAWDEAVVESCCAACGCLRARYVTNPYRTEHDHG